MTSQFVRSYWQSVEKLKLKSHSPSVTILTISWGGLRRLQFHLPCPSAFLQFFNISSENWTSLFKSLCKKVITLKVWVGKVRRQFILVFLEQFYGDGFTRYFSNKLDCASNTKEPRQIPVFMIEKSHSSPLASWNTQKIFHHHHNGATNNFHTPINIKPTREVTNVENDSFDTKVASLKLKASVFKGCNCRRKLQNTPTWKCWRVICWDDFLITPPTYHNNRSREQSWQQSKLEPSSASPIAQLSGLSLFFSSSSEHAILTTNFIAIRWHSLPI